MKRRPARALTAKDVKLGVKNGFTVKDFCTKFNIKGETSFLEKLESAYPNGGAEQMLREIRKNEKRHKGNKVIINNAQQRRGGNRMAKTQPISRIDVLRNQEANLSSEIIKLEVEHRDLASEHKNNLRQLRLLQEKYDELDREVKKCRKQLDDVCETDNSIVDKMNGISSNRTEKLASLDAVRAEIESLTVISIGVLKNCEFETIEGNFKIDLSGKEEEINILTHKLMDQEICADLTARQIRTLSRIITLRNSSSRKLEFVFDSSELENTYNSYLASYQPLSS